MTLAFDILQGIGLAGAAGVRAFLPTLLAGALASADLGLDFDHTDYAFLEHGWFLILIFVLLVVAVLGQRRLGSDSLERGPVGAVLAGIGIGLGALLFAGSLADDGYLAWPGLIGGIACAAASQVTARTLFARVRARLDEQSREAVAVYADGSSLVFAGVSIGFPPLGGVAMALVLWLLARSGRRGGQKYAGLRVLK